jgi:hypothetical protein
MELKRLTSTIRWQQLSDITGVDDAANETRTMSTSSAPSGFMSPDRTDSTLLSSVSNQPLPYSQPPQAENVQTTNAADHVPLAPATTFQRTMATPAVRPSTLSIPFIGSTQKLLPPARLFTTTVPPISTAPSTLKPGLLSQMRGLATRILTPSSRTMTRSSSVPTISLSSNVSTVQTTTVTNPTFITPSSTTNFVTLPTTSFVTPPSTSFVTPPTKTS